MNDVDNHHDFKIPKYHAFVISLNHLPISSLSTGTDQNSPLKEKSTLTPPTDNHIADVSSLFIH